MKIVNVKELNKGVIKDAPICMKERGVSKTTGSKKYKDLVCTLTIRTSKIVVNEGMFEQHHGILNMFAFYIENRCIVIGRTWDEFRELLQFIKSELKKNENIVVYCDKLSNKFQYLRGIYHFKEQEVIITGDRNVMKCFLNEYNIEMRCASLHSGLSFDDYMKFVGIECDPLEDVQGHEMPWNELSDKTLAGAENEVLRLSEAVRIDMKGGDDNLYTIPNTSTGYTRREVRGRVFQNPKLRAKIKKIYPNVKTFQMLHDCVMGGNVHANRRGLHEVINNVKMYDKSSSYVDSQINYKFPMSDFKRVPGYCSNELYLDLIYKMGKAVIAKLSFTNIRLKNMDTFAPYIPRHKCHRFENVMLDQGRIVKADYIEITITDVSFDIIQDMYDFDSFSIIECEYAKYDFLPDEFVETSIEKYREKTHYKGLDNIKYGHAKRALLGIYGMTLQDPTKTNIAYFEEEFREVEEDIYDMLEQNKKTAFCVYQWGVYTADWARYELQRMINYVEDRKGIVVYCDTDCVCYVGNIDWTEYNEEKKNMAIESGAHAEDIKHVEHFVGCAEHEGTFKKFATLGSKKYAYEDADGHTVITIAGVMKEDGGKEIDEGDRYGRGIARFISEAHPFVFRKSAGMYAFYNDIKTTEITVDGHKIELTPNIYLEKSTYSLSYKQDYIDILNGGLPTEGWSKEA